jgi:hypothetical protein
VGDAVFLGESHERLLRVRVDRKTATPCRLEASAGDTAFPWTARSSIRRSTSRATRRVRADERPTGDGSRDGRPVARGPPQPLPSAAVQTGGCRAHPSDVPAFAMPGAMPGRWRRLSSSRPGVSRNHDRLDRRSGHDGPEPPKSPGPLAIRERSKADDPSRSRCGLALGRHTSPQPETGPIVGCE